MHANNTEGRIFRIFLILQTFRLANISGAIKSKVATNSVNQSFRKACEPHRSHSSDFLFRPCTMLGSEQVLSNCLMHN